MADLPEEFADFELDTSGIDPNDPNQNPLSNQNPMSDWQRFVAQNLFDTQPKRRKAYLKRLGYEMSKDGSDYRPEGSTGKFKPIDPDNTVLGFIPWYDLFSEKGRAELAKDFGDIAFDVGVAGPLAGAGAAAAGTKGAALGATAGSVAPVVGTTIGGILGGFGGATAGGAAGNATAETVKKALGDLALDEEVPLDVQETLYQSLTVGAFSGLGKAGSSAFKNWRKMSAEKLQKTLKEIAVRKSNGTFNANLVEDFAKNPQNYTPEAVGGSTKKLLEFQDEIFGTSAENVRSTRQLTGGVAKDAIRPLNKQADLEIDRLSQMDEANFSLDEIEDTMRERFRPVTDKFIPEADEEQALDFVNAELKKLREKLAVPGEPGQFQELRFGQGREFLKKLQNAAFNDGAMKDNVALGRSASGLKQLADMKAGEVGSALPGINQKRKKILDSYQSLRQTLTDGTLQNGTIGKDSIAKQRALRVTENVDELLGTNITEGLQTTQAQAAVERLYNSPSSFGSGSVISDAMREGLTQAPREALKFGTLAGASAGVSLPPATAAKVTAAAAGVGAVKGFAKGLKEGASFSSPDKLVKQFSKVKTRLSDLNADPTVREAAQAGAFSLPPQAAVQAARELPPPQSSAPPQPAAAEQPVQEAPPEQQGVETPQQDAPVGLPPEFDDFELDTSGI